jgi:hypothetical protein
MRHRGGSTSRRKKMAANIMGKVAIGLDQQRSIKQE